MGICPGEDDKLGTLVEEEVWLPLLRSGFLGVCDNQVHHEKGHHAPDLEHGDQILFHLLIQYKSSVMNWKKLFTVCHIEPFTIL